MSVWSIFLPDGSEYPLDPAHGITVRQVLGAGMAPIENIWSKHALADGGQWQGARAQANVVTLLLDLSAVGEATFRMLRQELVRGLNPRRQVKARPLTLRHWGADGWRDLSCYYEAGMEGDFNATGHEQVALRLLAVDPFWHGPEETRKIPSMWSYGMFRYIAEWTTADGWDRLGPPVSVGAPGVGSRAVNAIAVDPATDDVYVGGNFTDWDGVAGADYIARWDGTDWYALGSGANAAVYDLLIAPNGDLYAAGRFSSMGGVANTRGIARWDGAAWNAVGTGITNAGGFGMGLLWGSDDCLWMVGDFTEVGGVAAANVAKWNGSAWAEVAGGTNDAVGRIREGLDGEKYILGNFTFCNPAGTPVAANRIARLDGDGATWTPLGSGFPEWQLTGDILVQPDGTLIWTGGGTTAGGVAANRIAQWDGYTWTPLGDGLNGTGYCLAQDAHGLIWVGGAFTQAGERTLAQRLAVWNGYSWLHADINLPGSPFVGALSITWKEVEGAEPAQRVLLGFSTAGDTYYSRRMTVTNEGTAPTRPVLQVRALAKRTLVMIRNETNGKALWFDLPLLAGETVTIDCRPGQQPVASDKRSWRLLGEVPLAGSQFASFELEPGDNVLSVFAWETNWSATVSELTVRVQPAYWGID